MKQKRFWISTAILVVLAIIIKIYSANPTRVEAGYAVGFYPGMAVFFRAVFGWLPFSFGDILFGLAGIWLLWKLIAGIKALIKRRITKTSFFDGLKKAVIIVLTINVAFNFFWGINYSRQGIATQLNLKIDSTNYADLTKVTTLITEKMNASKRYLITNNITYPGNAELFKRVGAAYDKTKLQFPFLHYRSGSIKSSMWGWLGNYTGFSGYYNPFTGEAQVNTTIPKFLQPFTTCHEVAHQLGYAKEDEANTVGYLAALHSGDSLLLYSTYFDLFNYTSRELRFQAFMRKDTILPKQLFALVLPEVKADMKEMYAFNNSHRNPIEPFIRSGYGFYLKNNNQPKGVLTYDDVTGFLIAYYKKFGKI
jgi:Protein of unknown function (DUF3810)